MFIAHFPAAWLSAVLLRKQLLRVQMPVTAYLMGAVAPDLDLLRFYLMDDRSVNHHHYITHMPALWMLVLLAGLLLPWQIGRITVAFAMGALLHLVLDSIVGAINWGWPITPTGAPLVVVPKTHEWWVASFLTHWTFLVEILICTAAYLKWRALAEQKKTPAKSGG